MSLKVFHLFFIGVSIALCAYVTVWGLGRFRAGGGGGDLVLAALCVVLGLGLIGYGVRVYRKFQELGR